MRPGLGSPPWCTPLQFPTEINDYDISGVPPGGREEGYLQDQPLTPRVEPGGGFTETLPLGSHHIQVIIISGSVLAYASDPQPSSRVYPNGVAGLAGHTHHLTHICVLAQPVKDIRQDLKCPLEYCCLRGCKKAIIGIKLFH